MKIYHKEKATLPENSEENHIIFSFFFFLVVKTKSIKAVCLVSTKRSIIE